MGKFNANHFITESNYRYRRSSDDKCWPFIHFYKWLLIWDDGLLLKLPLLFCFGLVQTKETSRINYLQSISSHRQSHAKVSLNCWGVEMVPALFIIFALSGSYFFWVCFLFLLIRFLFSAIQYDCNRKKKIDFYLHISVSLLQTKIERLTSWYEYENRKTWF